MYISELKLWSFRKYGKLNELDLENPSFQIAFQKGMNIISRLKRLLMIT